MTNDCPGIELEPEDHRVLRQLSMAAGNHERLVSASKLAKGHTRLGMDLTLWRDTIEYLRDMKFVEVIDQKVYVDIRCTCEGGAEAPEWLRKVLREQRQQPLERGAWDRLPPQRFTTSDQGGGRGAPQGARRFPPRGGEAQELVLTDSNRELEASRLSRNAKSLRTLRMPTEAITSEPSAKCVTTLVQLRSAFGVKFREAKIVDKLNLSAVRVLDKPEERFFLGALKNMRQEQGLELDVILAMMDEFMKLVLARAIPIKGKVVWKVFVARRVELFARVDRTRKLGSSDGKILPTAERERRADELLDRRRRPD